METDDKYIQGLNQGLSYDMNNYPRLLHLNKNNPKKSRNMQRKLVNRSLAIPTLFATSSIRSVYTFDKLKQILIIFANNCRVDIFLVCTIRICYSSIVINLRMLLIFFFQFQFKMCKLKVQNYRILKVSALMLQALLNNLQQK